MHPAADNPTHCYPELPPLRNLPLKISRPAFLHRFTGSRKLDSFCINDLFLIIGRGNARLHLAHLLVTPPKTMLFCIPSPLEGLLSVVQLLRLVQNHVAMSWLHESGQLARLARVKKIIEGPPCPSFKKMVQIPVFCNRDVRNETQIPGSPKPWNLAVYRKSRLWGTSLTICSRWGGAPVSSEGAPVSV